MSITKAEAQALAAFVTRCRPDWDHPGVMAAIERTRNLAGPAAIGAALCRLAENPELRTPAILPEPGPHWAGTTTATRKPPIKCPEHPTERTWDCQPCAALTSDPRPDQLRQALKEARR